MCILLIAFYHLYTVLGYLSTVLFTLIFSLTVMSYGFLHLQTFSFALCDFYVFCGEILWNNSLLIQLSIYSFICFSVDARTLIYSIHNDLLLILTLILSQSWPVRESSFKLAVLSSWHVSILF